MINLLLKEVFILAMIITTASTLNGKILKVGRGLEFETLRSAAAQSKPGDTIVIRSGTYPGGEIINNLRGSGAAWITIRAEYAGKVTFIGGASGFQFSDPAYVRIEGFIFLRQTGNGVNIDDGGTFDTPAHHIIFENCEWRDMDATGNNDELKMSGVEDFTVRNCRFLNGSKGGSLIDMVGCHSGIIQECFFGNGGSNSIQVKGGSSEITIHRNRFNDGGERAINIGGSTGLQFFRPAGASYEASDIRVWANIFTGSTAAIAFVGSNNCEVTNNTIIQPEKWVLRILQENTGKGMKACSNNKFINNIVVYTGTGKLAVNVGPNTAPETFIFSNNMWYNPLDTLWVGPNTPVKDINSIINHDPEFTDTDYNIANDSPAIGKGYPIQQPEYDYFGNIFAKNRTIGAIENVRF